MTHRPADARTADARRRDVQGLTLELTRWAVELRTAMSFVTPPLVERSDERAAVTADRLRHALFVAESLQERLGHAF